MCLMGPTSSISEVQRVPEHVVGIAGVKRREVAAFEWFSKTIASIFASKTSFTCQFLEKTWGLLI